MDLVNILITLFLAGVAAYFTWRAYSLQRIASTPAGLQFLVAPVNRERPSHEPAATHVALGVYARGPGIRYNTTLAIWGTVDARDFSDSRTSWSAEDEPLSCEVALEGHHLERPVYFGVVWESPSFWHRSFVEHGYRIKLAWGSDGKTVKADHFEVWKAPVSKGTKGEWKLMPSSVDDGDHTTNSTAGAKLHSATLNDQLKRKTENGDWDMYWLF